MAKRWIALNLLLAACALLLGWHLRASMLRFIADNDPSGVQPARGRKAAVSATGAGGAAKAQAAPPMDFSVIPEKTIFSDARSKVEAADASEPPAVMTLQPKPILVGVTIAGDLQRALIIDPGAAAREGGRAESKRIGDVYRGYAITAIASDHIVMENGPHKEIIPLHAGPKGVQTGKTPIIATRVVAFGNGASGSAPIRVASAVTAPPVTPATTPNVAPAPAVRTPTITLPGGVSGRRATGGVPQNPAIQPPVNPPAPPNSGGTRVIRTPFGDIVRPNRN